jgi:hypothetical protein
MADRRCFIAAGAGTDFSAVQEALAKEGWDAFLVTDLPARAVPFPELLRIAISDADLVAGVLSGSASDQTVVFELGIASALSKPIVIAAFPDVSVPSALNSLPLVRLAPGSQESLALALRHVVDHYPGEAAQGQSKATPLGDRADQVLSVLRDAETEIKLIQALVAALEASGATVVQEGRGGRARFDLGVWSPELGASVGNPFLIEVKSRLRGGAELEKARHQVLSYLPAVKGSWAMVVYGEGPPSSALELDVSGSPVLLQRADELVASMRDESFPEVVRKLRNQRAHLLRSA